MDELKELKSRAYDLLALVQQAQLELQDINKKIAEKSAEKSTELTKKEPEKK